MSGLTFLIYTELLRWSLGVLSLGMTTAVPCCHSSAPGSQRRFPVVIPALSVHNGGSLLSFQHSRFTTAVPCCHSSPPGSQRRFPVVIPRLSVHNGGSLLSFQHSRFTTAVHRCESTSYSSIYHLFLASFNRCFKEKYT